MSFSISPQGLSLIMEHEGFFATPKQLPSGAWVVGHGHVREDAPGKPVTKEEAEVLLREDLEPVADLVNDKVEHPLTQAQFDALVSFAFSVGVDAFESSQILRRVNAGDVIAAACLVDAWRKTEVGGKLEAAPALIRRRAVEKAMLLCGVDYQAFPSAFLQPRLDHAAAVLGAPVKYAVTPEVGSVVPMAAKSPTADLVACEPGDDVLVLTQVVSNDFEEAANEVVPVQVQPVADPVQYARAALRRAQVQPPHDPVQDAASQWRRKADALSASAAAWVGNLRGVRKA